MPVPIQDFEHEVWIPVECDEITEIHRSGTTH